MRTAIEWVMRIGADPRDDDDTRADKALLVLISVLILPVSLVWASLYLGFGSPVGWVPLAYSAVLLGNIVVFSRTRNFGAFLLVGQLAILFAPTLSMIPLGGFIDAGGVGLWGILAPLAALVFSDVRSAVRWYVAWVIVFLGSGFAGELLGGVSPAIPRWFTTTMLALNVTVGGTIVFTLLAVFARERRNALAALRDEQARAESLLLNILPRSIAERLKADTRTIADQIGSASILFADVVDFTPLAERLPPTEVVAMLDRLFRHFDDLADRYGLEKIKTIGDCYMVAAGVPAPRPDHARVLARMALDMQEAMSSGDEIEQLGLELRVGINSGPVVAGVIGRKRFLYDLWGDAVNTASRMESHGTSGRIQITRTTKDLLGDEFVCEPRGPIPVKGKGEIEAWYLVGRRAAPALIASHEMDPERARELLAAERRRIEQALARLEAPDTAGESDEEDASNPGADLYQDEFDEGRADDLREGLAAIDRAEARIDAGTYGLSVESGEPIPDERLEAIPTAERTAEEEAR